ncbi:MAG: ATP-binding cassette domain-containing protein [Spirochaetaceae bacterium]|nr:MAG: ATP-binding cassette domain-containing protein [Spirochaetaceae bacterium]
MNRPLLEVEDLATHFTVSHPFGLSRRAVVRAVDGVSFSLAEGETFALVGESGCGKTTTGRSVLRLIEPTRGTVRLDGTDVTQASKPVLRALRRSMQLVFQDPYGSLNPRMTVGRLVAEPLVVHGLASGREAGERARELLSRCGLAPWVADRHPHAFSGGQRQRIVIARALITDPQLLVADEPVSALDVSIQSQIINLMIDVQKQFGLGFLLISHDLGVVRHMADRVAVMYLGRLVEVAPRQEFFSQPLHPYSQALLSAVPREHPQLPKTRIALAGEPPSPTDPPPGCPFHTRCPHAMPVCSRVTPQLRPAASGRTVACHLHHPPEGLE